MPICARIGLGVLFSPSTIYILLLIFSPDHLYSREYSRILRIVSTRGRPAEAKNHSKVEVCALKPLRNVQASKRKQASSKQRPKTYRFPSALTQNLPVEGQKSCFSVFREALVKTVLDDAIVTSRIFKNILLEVT